MNRRAMLAALAVFALIPQAHAGALIANCTLKANADILTMPSPGDEHVLTQAPKQKEIAVEVYDEYGGQWAYVTPADRDDPERVVDGWVLRSSLSKCQNTKPWKKR
jgi:hypothetical protein